MSTNDGIAPSTTTTNERRKAQNRASQKKYRSRQKLRVELAKAVLLGTQYPDLPQQLQGSLSGWPSSAGFPDDDSGESLLDPSQLETSVTAQDRRERPKRQAIRRNNNTTEAGPSPPMELAEKGDGGDSILSGDGPGHVSPSSEYINNMPFGMFFSVSPERAQNPSADLTGAEWLSRMDPILTQVTTESPPTTSVCDATLTKHAHVPKATSIPTPACTLAEPSSTPARSASAGSSANTLSLSHCNRVHGSLGQDERESCLMEDDAARNGDFSNPLVTALSLGNTEIASLLIQSGAQVDARDPKGQTALFRAVKRGDRRMACLLLDYGANILAADSSGTQIVHVAVSRNDTEMVRALLEWCRRYDEAESSRPKHLLQQVLNARQETGLTFVHQAVSLQYTDIIKVLLEFGADVNLGCAYGGH